MRVNKRNEALQIVNLDAWHGKAQVLFGVSLTVKPGEGVALLGRNGAGKTATFLAILGLIRISRGQVQLGGHSMVNRPLHEIARAGLGWVPEDRRLFADLSVGENIRAGQTGRPGPWTPARLLDLFPALEPLWNRRASLLSGGEQQMVAIARTLAGNPTLLLLDEPSEGLAPLVVATLTRAVESIKAEGVGVLLSEQNPRFAEPLADRICLIEAGHLVWCGAPQDVDDGLRERVLSV